MLYCPCEALVEDNAEELHCLLDLDRDVIDLQDDICVCVCGINASISYYIQIIMGGVVN